VAVTAGASAPESLVNEVLDALNPTEGVTITSVTVEDEYFHHPGTARDAQDPLGVAGPGARHARRVEFRRRADRRFTAAEVLSAANR